VRVDATCGRSVAAATSTPPTIRSNAKTAPHRELFNSIEHFAARVLDEATMLLRRRDDAHR
jgi:hypothetical protein